MPPLQSLDIVAQYSETQQQQHILKYIRISFLNRPVTTVTHAATAPALLALSPGERKELCDDTELGVTLESGLEVRGVVLDRNLLSDGRYSRLCRGG